ncbi:MAG: hypothetical protein WCC06_12690 [Candidatus Aminicenantales bacterium]
MVLFYSLGVRKEISGMAVLPFRFFTPFLISSLNESTQNGREPKNKEGVGESLCGGRLFFGGKGKES